MPGSREKLKHASIFALHLLSPLLDYVNYGNVDYDEIGNPVAYYDGTVFEWEDEWLL